MKVKSLFPVCVCSVLVCCYLRNSDDLEVQRSSVYTDEAAKGWESESRSVLSDSLQPHRLYSPWNSPGQNTGVGRLSLLQGIFPTQGQNPGLLHCRWILYQLSHKEIPRILEQVAYPSPADPPDPEIKLGFPALQKDSLPTELSGKPSFTFFSALNETTLEGSTSKEEGRE